MPDLSRAALSGLLLAFSFPSHGHPLVAWIALVPLLLALRRGSLPTAFLLGLTTGVLYFTGTLYWISHVMVLHGGLPWWVAVLVNAALIAYLALFPALFAVVMRRLVARFGVEALLAAPLVWVATELGRTYLFTGFPWVLLGYSQMRALPVVQLASAFGVYGVSALVAGVSGGLALAVHRRSQTAGYDARGMAPAAVPIALAVAAAVWGGVRLADGRLTRMGSPVRVGLVQGNVDQAEKWNPARADAIFEDYLRQTEAAVAMGAELVVWPEASTPFSFEEQPAEAERIRAIARRSNVSILIGSNELDRGTPQRLYNAAFAVGADGRTQGVYRKMHLVPFGEYVPLPRLFFFAAPLVEAVGMFSPGDHAATLPVNGHAASTAICYEVVYPALVRRFVAAGSELLTTITNDAWFGRTSAPYQHFEQAAMRAVENGLYLVRAANTGVSGVVDPYGRIVAASPIFEPAIVVREARFLRASTLYARHGDVFAYACAIAAAVMLVFPRGARRTIGRSREASSS